MKSLYSIFNMGFTAVLFIIFAIASALATIIESVYNTDAAWTFVYKTYWFGAIQVLLGLSLFINIFKYKMYQGFRRLPSFVFHISFLFILIGSIITRYFGFEGILHIRENTENNIVTSSEVFIQMKSKENNDTYYADTTAYLSEGSDNKLKLTLPIKDKDAKLTYKDFITNATLKWTQGDSDISVMELIFSDLQNKKEVLMTNGETIEIGDLSLAFETEPKQSKYIKIISKDGKFYINTTEKITFNDVKTNENGILKTEQDEVFDQFKIYNIDGINFSIKTLLKSAVQYPVKIPDKSFGNNAILAQLEFNGEKKDVFVFFGDTARKFNVGGKDFFLTWGPKEYALPFSIFLKDFQIQRYPGSNSPSGYSSDVIVNKDKPNQKEYKIYMNHVLDYEGYRFFQSSYDNDERGTILSVNKDPGKIPTYIGYFLLCIGMFFNFFNPKSRFSQLSRLIDESSNRLKNKTTGIMAILILSIFCASPLQSQNLHNIQKEHANKLSSLIVQGFDGRMEPFDTAALELMHKIYRGGTYNNLNHVQVMLSIMSQPEYWRDAKFIKVSNKELKKILGLNIKDTHAKFGDFFEKDKTGKSVYKIGRLIEEANRKPIGNRTTLDKDLIKVDERLNIFYAIFMGEMFKIIPKQNDPNNSWFSTSRALFTFEKDEALEVSKILEGYFANVLQAQNTNDWTKADEGLQALKQYQLKYGGNVIPSQNQINAEIMFNKLNLFENLTPIYLLSGFALLIFVFIRLLKPKVNINLAFKYVYAINIIVFIVHTIGLGLRWYISEHAPWSNAYESLVYIAWALSLSGMIFSKRSPISLSLTSILAGVTLFVAHLSGMDPQITNIQPVLNSYWLTVHVSVITASYGFLGLCALLGMFTLILFIIKNKKTQDNIQRNILEATRINEMSMILGICLLTCGNFLGGVWANESWGRYWGWDSKETWALITILVYAAIVHFRFIPKLNNQFWFAVASMFAYSSVIMTYFGVNFYLTGKHSYAAGESIPVPTSVWVAATIFIILSVVSFFKRKGAQRL